MATQEEALPQGRGVFINYRGEELRYDDQVSVRGAPLCNLIKMIEEFRIAIVIFSSRYTESRWCLEELVKIKERVHQRLLKVLPIYYKVTPTNVKRLKGEFGDHFRDEEYLYGSDEPKIKRWKEAILYVSQRFALTFDEKSSVLEIDFIENIVKEVLKMLPANSTTESSQSCS